MKTIEEAAKEYAKLKSSSKVFIDSHIDDFKAGIKFAQQWISIEDELPPIETEFNESIMVLVKDKNNDIYLAFYNYDTKEWFTIYKVYKVDPVYWKLVEVK